jgi:hypothetical protein
MDKGMDHQPRNRLDTIIAPLRNHEDNVPRAENTTPRSFEHAWRQDLQFRVLNRYSTYPTMIGESEIIELLVQDCGTNEAQHRCSGFNCDRPF